MKIKNFLMAGMILSFSAGMCAVTDPDFESCKTGELPLWSGAPWAKASTNKFTAKIVEDAKSAASGKKYLRTENNSKRVVWVIAYPSQKFEADTGVEITMKVRGKGDKNIGFNIYDAKGKIRPWRPAICTPYQKIDTQKWQELKFRYMPVAGDEKFMISLGNRGGVIDWDDLKIRYFKVEAAAK